MTGVKGPDWSDYLDVETAPLKNVDFVKRMS